MSNYDGLSWVGASWERGLQLAEEEYKLWNPSMRKISSRKRKYTFYMNDAWGDDFHYTVEASSEEEARGIAEMQCDDASCGKLIGIS